MTELQCLAARIVGRVLSGRSLDAELRSPAAQAPALEAPARAALHDLCFGTLRFLGEADAVLAHLLDRPLRHAALRDLLRVAIYQLAHTRAAPYAVVDHAVRASARIGPPAAKGLINATLRNFLRQKEGVLAVAHASDHGRYSLPSWWIEKVRAQYPAAAEQILAAGNGHPPLTLRVNSRATDVARYLERLQDAGIAARALGGAAVTLERPLPVDRIPGFAEGMVSVQDAAAQHAALAIGANAGARVLDACAAPGGKTAHLLERADIELVALDQDAQRLARVESNLARLRLAATVVCADAGDPSSWWDGRPFDCVLADVPCSGSGVLRRHPDIKWLRRPSDVAAFAQRQGELLNGLWQVLRSGGKLLYATCSVFLEENEAQVQHFLEHHHDARRLTLPEPQTNAQLLAGQILPDEQHDGFFYALVQKI